MNVLHYSLLSILVVVKEKILIILIGVLGLAIILQEHGTNYPG